MTAVWGGRRGLREKTRGCFVCVESKNKKHMILSIRSCSLSIRWNGGFIFRKGTQPSLVPDCAFCHPLNIDNLTKL